MPELSCTTEITPLTRAGMPLQVRDARGQSRACSLGLQLHYDPSDPLAVSLRFATRDSVAWTFARDLLADGCLSPVGVGDVAIAPTGSGVCLTLYPGEERESRFLLDAMLIESFLDESYALVARGRELSEDDLDEVLAALLA